MKTEIDVFEDRFIEVMQFVVNHTTFEPLGIAPGNTYDPDTAPEIDGDALRAVAR